ncbi:MAG: DUF2065 domain-containing protein [Betaproteobacteria bacterium]|nr:DUF2065 domain-containing protein [Betaproteobacteria bacterium]
MHSLLLTFALLLVLEGAMPFLAPGRWRETILRICKFSDGQIRFLGFGAILVGLILMQVVK